MKNNHKRNILILVIIFLLTWGLSSCAAGGTATAQAWIDYPSEGESLPLGAPVTVLSHGFARQGVAEVVLAVNGEAYRRDVPAEVGSDFASMGQVWVPVEAGLYTLQVQVYDRQGGSGTPATVSVEVLGQAEAATPTLVVTVTPVDTLTAVVTMTQVVTVTPVITLTPVVITFTSPPPVEPPPPEADTQAPPVPTPVVPANGLELVCRATQTLAWLPVDDPSGISGYYVRLEKEITPGEWQSAAGYGPVPDKQVGVNVDCGLKYRWAVRAEDGAGNFSGWSAFSQFSVTLN